MLISEYIQKYTSRKRIHFAHVLSEIRELFWEILKMNKEGIAEEFQDVVHMMQLWVYWRFKINGEIWGWSKKSVTKFINRTETWQEMYEYLGLPRDISGYCGNYQKSFKVVKHLKDFGISEERALEAYNSIVKNKK
mgnify:CR=1 FL=1